MASCVGETERLQKCVSRLDSANGAPAARGTQHIGGSDSGARGELHCRGAGLNDLGGGGALAAPLTTLSFSQSEFIPLAGIETNVSSGIMGINLEGVVWTSLYSLETWDLRSRECRAVWCWGFFWWWWWWCVCGVATA